MSIKTFEILDSSKIQSFSIKVTEQIHNKYLLDFLRTSIISQKITLTKKTKFYFQFIASAFSYEIIVFEANSQDTFLEPFVFSSLCDTKGIELFITKEYFSLFKGKKLLLYKKIENILQEDIQTYIEQLYKMKIDKVTILDTVKSQLAKDTFLNSSLKDTFTFYSVHKDHSFSIFLVFISFVSMIFILLLYSLYNHNYNTNAITKTTTKYDKGYKKLYGLYNEINKRAINKTLKFISYCKNSDILIDKINYKHSKLFIELKDKSQKKILKVVKNYEKNIEISSILYDNSLKIYKVAIVLDVKK